MSKNKAIHYSQEWAVLGILSVNMGNGLRNCITFSLLQFSFIDFFSLLWLAQ